MMVVKSATKKKLMDKGVPEQYAHILADDRKWDQLRKMSPLEIQEILTDAKIKPKIPIANLSLMIWLVVGRMEIRFYEDDDTMIGFAPEYLDPDDEGIFYDYDMATGKMERKVEGFRGLGSLFSDPTVHDWFNPSLQVTGLLTNTGKVRMNKVPPNGTTGHMAIVDNLLDPYVMRMLLKSMERTRSWPENGWNAINRENVLELFEKDNNEDEKDGFEGLGSLFG
jgi:hypothetical protein